MKKNIRFIAASILSEVIQGHSLSDSLPKGLATLEEQRDRALLQAICFGACRFYHRLFYILNRLLNKPLSRKENMLQAILIVGLYQLLYTRIPVHAAISETVNAGKMLKKNKAAGLINAILREYLRKKEMIEKELINHPSAHFSHPDWMINQLQKDWPHDWQTILENNNQHPPYALRVIGMQREAYLDMLISTDLLAHPISHTQQGLILETAVSVEGLPGFAEGKVVVQDGAAQLAASLLDLKPGMRVLDACAAPGGKLMHILETQPLEVIAIEKEAQRLALLEENLKRVKLNATLIHDKAERTAQWWDGILFDRILLDVPCSSSGVIRRHPDIKLTRQPKDLSSLAKKQAMLLARLWPLLKKGGLLLYATCSIFPEENTKVVENFLNSHLDVQEIKISQLFGRECNVGRQILPGNDEMDGFYYALLKKY